MITGKLKKQVGLMIKGNTPGSRVKRFLFVYELLRRYVRGDATERERAVINTWHAGEEEYFLEKEGQELPSAELYRMDECVYRKVAVSQQFPETNWKLVSQQAEVMHTLQEAIPASKAGPVGLKKQRPRVIRIYGSIAAMIAVIAAIGLYHYYTKEMTFETQNSQLSQQLPDNTRVLMNRDSRLVLGSDFNGRTRSVEMKGEIFFDVAKNPQKPFIIAHSVLQTEVKGTSFTVKDYPELDVSTVTVRTGVVTVSRGGKRLATLLPDKQLVYNKITGEHTVRDTNWKASAGWVEGNIVLIDADEKELALRIRQYFGKELVIEDAAFGHDICFNSEFAPNATLAEVMGRLMLVYDAQYKIDGNRIVVYR
ncbi:FecR family protein [uncultured Bacteroides sp.]|uniref:FecR family protein n=1 Tax=uncultured Bacteroides sp. TaxID=162156 RepID=UPI002AA8EBA0|nr:FecR family protein [uncultured Bacteroides sp.]